MTRRILQVARDELRDAVAYYNQESPGLGFAFAAEVLNTVRRIELYPLAWTRLSPLVRRCLLKRFPYAVIYAIEPDEALLIVGIAHLHKGPIHWEERIR